MLACLVRHEESKNPCCALRLVTFTNGSRRNTPVTSHLFTSRLLRTSRRASCGPARDSQGLPLSKADWAMAKPTHRQAQRHSAIRKHSPLKSRELERKKGSPVSTDETQTTTRADESRRSREGERAIPRRGSSGGSLAAHMMWRRRQRQSDSEAFTRLEALRACLAK
jgi:hypothetical protein